MDATDLTEDLDSYLRKHASKFDTVYDGHVPEGERLEKIIEKLEQCDILILIITRDSLTSGPIAEEITIAKEKDMKIIPFKNKFLNKGWKELPWKIPEYKGLIFENKFELRRLAIYALDNIIDELEKETSQKYYEEKEPTKILEKLILQIDKSVYIYNSDLICTIINTNKTSTKPINLVILSEEKKTVYKNPIPINPDGDGIYQEVIHVGGNEWSLKPGSAYLITAEHEGNKARVSFYLSSFGAAIELDQKVYTWTDRVYITVVAPDLVSNTAKIERIGNNEDSKIIISTRKGKLENYELVETKPNSGIFVGDFRLTGFPNYDARGDGQYEKTAGTISGKGPSDGLLACDSDDAINVVLKTKHEEYSGSALVRWNIGEIQWKSAFYNIGDTGVVILIDPDLNLNPDVIELIPIRVWSDSDPVGITLLAIETGNNTGIFIADLQFGIKTTKNQLKVSPEDTVSAEYVDRTLPDPYGPGQILTITGTSSIR